MQRERNHGEPPLRNYVNSILYMLSVIKNFLITLFYPLYHTLHIAHLYVNHNIIKMVSSHNLEDLLIIILGHT